MDAEILNLLNMFLGGAGAGLIIVLAFAILIIILLVRSIVIVPQQASFIVERLGKFHKTLEAGFHLLIPVVDSVAYKFSLKEEVISTPSQTCFTRDNVNIEVDGLVYIKVEDPQKAAYGITDYRMAASQLSQTSLRSIMGQLDLDKTFEERDMINAKLVEAIDQAAETWGIKVLRYEIKDITPPPTVRAAMEAQMTAERQKRALIAQSEGQKQEAINISEGQKQQAINLAGAEQQRLSLEADGQRQRLILEAQGEREKRVLEAEGQAQAIERVAQAQAKQIEWLAQATAEGIRLVASAYSERGGEDAANLRVAEQMVSVFGQMAKEGTTMLIPQNMSDISGIVATAMGTLSAVKVKKS